MLIPVYLAFVTHDPIIPAVMKRRLQTLVEFFHLDTPEFKIHYAMGERGGLIFVDQAQSPCTAPLVWQEENRLTVSAYLPFGIPRQADAEALRTGRYLPDMVDRLSTSPLQIRHLAPPQVWADFNRQEQRLIVFNDYRGFGRLYEYTSHVGTIWTNKMAAAPILAATTARMDKAAWAGFAANGLFYGGSTGFANMTYVLPGTWLQADLQSGLIERSRFSTDTGGVTMETLPASAAEECGDALAEWWRDLGCLTSGPHALGLSGGRDSRVVAAYALTSNLDIAINTFSPPALDADLAERLVKLTGRGIPFTRNDSRKVIASVYKKSVSLLQHASAISRANNPDVCVSTFLDCHSPSTEFLPAMSFSIGGQQGEITHPYQYDIGMMNNESYPAARFSTVCDYHSKNAWGVTQTARAAARERLESSLLVKAASANIDGFYLLDFMYLDIYLNRHWAGAVGAYDAKTPLTVYPYVRYGFNQPLTSKLNSSFVREVVTLAMPQWRDVPFFHEFPIEQQHDFHSVHPTWWEMGRGEELMEIYASYPELWEWFDKDTVMEAAHRWQYDTSDDLAPRDTAFRALCHRCAQRQVWLLAFLQELDEINKTIGILQK